MILPAIHDVLERMLGPRRVANIVRPEIWMWPQLFYSLVCLGFSLVSALWAWRHSAAARRRAA